MVLLVSTILQTHNVGFGMEIIQVDTYGTIQVAVTVLIVPVIVILIAYNLRGLRRAKAEDAQPQVVTEIETANPLDQSDDAN